MKISPMDIQRQTFGVRFRGFDPDEVRTFLAVVAEEMAALQREKDEIEQQLRRPRADGRASTASARPSSRTRCSPRRRWPRTSARSRGARRTPWSSRPRCRATGCSSWRRPAPTRSSAAILELRAHRTGLRTDIRALVTRLSHVLDLQEEAELEDNLRFLKRREEASGQ